jgi:hypothetical protein
MEILKRLWFVLLIPVFYIILVLSVVLMLPYWVLTGEITYDSTLFRSFENYHNNLYDTTRNTR